MTQTKMAESKTSQYKCNLHDKGNRCINEHLKPTRIIESLLKQATIGAGV